MLPTFSKIVEFRSRSNRRLIERMAAQLSPPLGEIDRHVQFEGEKVVMHRHDQTVGQSDMKPISAEITIKRTPLDEYTPRKLVEQLFEIAGQFAKGFSESFYKEMERVTSETGQIVDGKGKPFNEELFLEALDKMDLEFDEDGNWIKPSLHVGSQVAKAIAGSTPSEEFGPKLEALIVRKRDDFRRREATRVLAR